MTKEYKSLEEVHEMKDAAWKDFLESGYSSYVDYIKAAVKDFKIQYNIKNSNIVLENKN